MKVLALIQARMGSTRLPGKVLSPLLGKPMLQWQLERLRQSERISQIVVATSTLLADDPIVAFCAAHAVECFRGPEDNVLERFHSAALRFLGQEERNDAILIRLTGDCPLIDPMAIDEGISQFLDLISQGCRYFGYDDSLPDGMDFELFTWDALHEAWSHASDSFEKEHVTPFMWRNPERFGARKFTKAGIPKGLRFSVDYPEDLALVSAILQAERAAGKLFGMREISDLLAGDAALRAINAQIIKNEGLIITALKSAPFRVDIDGISVARYGVMLPDGKLPDQSFFDWATRIGVNVWAASGELEAVKSRAGEQALVFDAAALPRRWAAFAGRNDWRAALYAAANDPSDDGMLLQASEIRPLAELLMFLCQERFQYRP
jgi:spore coat polysaccharide biosynthesis protein SpsF